VKIIIISEKMYGIPLRIVIGSYSEYAGYCKKHYGLPEEKQQFYGGESSILSFDSGRAEALIWIEKFSFMRIFDLGSLSHECNHAALKVLNRIGIKTKPGNEEPLCYLQEYFFTEALKKMAGEISPAAEEK